MKIHYTVYGVNYDRGEATSPMCNDRKRLPYYLLTRKHEEVTCKNCLKSIRKTLETVISIRKMKNKDCTNLRIELDKINMMLEVSND